MDIETKRGLIERENDELSITEQCDILGLNKSTLYYHVKPEYSEEDLIILNRMDEIFTKYPFMGYRRIYCNLLEEGYSIGRDRVLKYMGILGLEAIYPKKQSTLSIPNREHKIYPYLLRDIEINRPNQVWSIDITYIKIVKGFVYLVAIIDWFSRYLLSYSVSNSLDVHFCKETLNDALSKYNKPCVLNSDQGSQFTSKDFINILLKNDIAISMDSKGRAIDNIIIERFFRSIKYENIYINEYNSV